MLHNFDYSKKENINWTFQIYQHNRLPKYNCINSLFQQVQDNYESVFEKYQSLSKWYYSVLF